MSNRLTKAELEAVLEAIHARIAGEIDPEENDVDMLETAAQKIAGQLFNLERKSRDDRR